jgi:hypothetical protein
MLHRSNALTLGTCQKTTIPAHSYTTFRFKCWETLAVVAPLFADTLGVAHLQMRGEKKLISVLFVSHTRLRQVNVRGAVATADQAVMLLLLPPPPPRRS